MLAGGAEESVCAASLAGFANMKALSRRNDAPQKASRPFDKDRDGFVLGEGAGSLVLTWPASIGGYTMQSKSNLASTMEPWQDITNNVVQSNNLNRVTITPKPGGDNHRLQINLNE